MESNSAQPTCKERNHAALAHADALLWLTPFAFEQPDYLSWARTAGQTGAPAVKRHSVKRVVLISSVGAQHDFGVGPIACLPAIEDAFNGNGSSIGTTFTPPFVTTRPAQRARCACASMSLSSEPWAYPPLELKTEIARRFAAGSYRPPERAGLSYVLAPLMRTYMSLDPGDKTMMTMMMPHVMYCAPNVIDADVGGLPPPPLSPYPFVFEQGPTGVSIQRPGDRGAAKIVAKETSLTKELCSYPPYLCLETRARVADKAKE
jgi:hypothetical protein